MPANVKFGLIILSFFFLKICINSVRSIGHIFLNNSASVVEDNLKIKILIQNIINISSAGEEFSAFLITSIL